LALKNAAAVNKRVAALDRSSPSGGLPLHRAFSAKLRLNVADTARFMTFASQVEQELDALDKQASALIVAARKRRTADGLIPPPPKELHDLEVRRRNVVARSRERMAADLGSAIAARVDEFARTPARLTGPATN